MDRYLIVGWTQKRDAFGNVLNIYHAALYDSVEQEPEIPTVGRAAELRLLQKANNLCRIHGPVAIGRMEGGFFVPTARLERPLEPTPTPAAKIVHRCSIYLLTAPSGLS